MLKHSPSAKAFALIVALCGAPSMANATQQTAYWMGIDSNANEPNSSVYHRVAYRCVDAQLFGVIRNLFATENAAGHRAYVYKAVREGVNVVSYGLEASTATGVSMMNVFVLFRQYFGSQCDFPPPSQGGFGIPSSEGGFGIPSGTQGGFR